MPSFTIAWVADANNRLRPVDLPGNYRGQSHHGFENSGLSGPIGTHHRHHLSLADPQRHVVQGRDDAIVDGYARQLKQHPAVGGLGVGVRSRVVEILL